MRDELVGKEVLGTADLRFRFDGGVDLEVFSFTAFEI
jgi:hypothetical protein